MPETAVTLDVPVLERRLMQIRSVTAARIVCATTGLIDEIHVVGTPSRNPKQVVRDVETMLLVQHGIRVDHRKVSLVQIDDRRVTVLPPRIVLIDIQQGEIENADTTTVTLGLNESRVQGRSSPRPGQEATPEELIGYATTHALDQLITPRGHIRLEQLRHQPFGAVHICLAHLTLTVEDGVEVLLGVSVVSDNLRFASARAVLDAVNRRLPRLMQQ